LVVSAGIALASWQTQPATPGKQPQALIPAVLPAPAASVAVELPVARVRKRAPVILAQVQQTAPAPQAAQSVEQQLRDALQREDTALNGLATPYKKWLNEDVAYIITDEERKAFKTTGSDEEREQFITQFWQRRDPTPGTPENEFKSEHYRRIAYANEHYATKIPGWKTDRGRIYITFGPPDEIEDHSSGGVYERPPAEGGGTTSTFPFQQWRYRHIDGIGDNIIIEFVDPTMSGEFHMTSDPAEKDALLYVPGAGLTTMEQMGLSDKTQRFKNTDGAHLGQALSGQPANIFVSVGDGPKVTVSITSDKMNTHVSLALPSGSGKSDIIARITDTHNRAASNLRDVISAGQLNYTSGFALAPGSYTLTLVTRYQVSGVMQTTTVNFYVN
jgi:GWxTD domain-containing protein